LAVLLASDRLTNAYRIRLTLI